MNSYYGNEIECALLQTISECSEPVGAGMLCEKLQEEKGALISEATIGRYLRKLEQKGYLKSEKYDGRPRGRSITEKGRARVRELNVKQFQLRSISQVMNLLKDGIDEQLRNILITRAIIEPEAAALAAKYATEENLAAMRSILEEMDHLTEQGESMAGTDAPFHIEIARASGNPFLESILKMLRADKDYSPEIEAILRIPLQKTPSDHWNIYKAIREHDADKARRIMKKHIQCLIEKLDAYDAETKCAVE